MVFNKSKVNLSNLTVLEGRKIGEQLYWILQAMLLSHSR